MPNSIKYSRKGSSYECLKKGYGIADWEHRKKGLSRTSLQQIMYVGPTYEANFKRKQIYSITSLVSKMNGKTAAEKKTLLYAVCKRKNGGVDHKAVNSIILFLHDRGVKNLPTCKIVKE